ncbi:FimV/HubP family polar landmark protein [Vibrio mangrovi]|uniref:FimV/HubP family polar landmark protein n=1 Tax=Vibrio mangrovi TaxID=474394 RepID=A0ABU4I832_9VIBR|nr:FimV/HubP family polar landmark protein [Vibrio mangrovi]MDW6003445.1 FimV/HubP family polar landmark protein [Vibrio mangrovi]
MRQFFKRLLLPVAIAAVGQISFVHAEGIRLLGPTGKVQSSPQYSEVVRSSAAQSNNEPAKFYGPTSENETLWSIASQLRPSNQVTVQQTLLAIYQLNPQSFEQQNIHSLIPGSRLRIPSLVQIQSVTTEEATRVMQSHQQRLTQTSDVAPASSSSPVRSQVTAIAEPQPTQQRQTETQPTQPKVVVREPSSPAEKIIPTEEPAAEASQPVLSFSQPSDAASDTEILALEEKNHRLTLMLSKVQAEVSELKNELGDENKVRTEVEKLLAEERRKREEAERMAPTSLDRLLSNGWAVTLLALIPGLLIALLIVWLIGRRKTSEAAPEVTTEQQELSDEPISIGDAAGLGENDDELDDLVLDDDLFSTANGEAGEEAPDGSDTDDVFAELEDVDLDLDLGDESEEDLFASIDDDGDLVDTDLDDEFAASTNGISVNSEDKAVGLEEMERALEDVSLASDDEENAATEDFDLSSAEQVGMSQEEIERLLDGDDSEDESSGSIDQSMLDELLADEQEDDFRLDDTEDEFDLGGVGVASDSDLEALFDSIEEQSDLEQLEANSQDISSLDELPDIENASETVSDESTALLDELLAEEDDSEEPDWDKELDDLTSFDLSDTDDVIQDKSVLDVDLDIDTEPEEDTSPLDDGTELFDELLEIEQQSLEEDDEFNREGFIDDLISSAPDTDPLLDELDFDESESTEESGEDFDFNPEIEGSELVDESISANEFGIPQDDDWLIDEDESLSESALADELEAALETEPEIAPETEPEATQTEAAVEQEEVESESDFIDEVELPEFDEIAALNEVDELLPEVEAPEAELPVEAEETPVVDEPETAFESEPEFAPDIEPEAMQAEAAVEQAEEAEPEPDFIDEAELPEFDEIAALNEVDELLPEVEAPEAELPVEAEETPVVDEPETAFESEPEFAPDIEPEAMQAEAAVEQAEEAEPEPDFIDEAELPEFDELAALNEADELLAEDEAPEAELPTGAEEIPVVDESETAFETEPEFAPDVEPEPEATQAEATVEQAEEAEPEPDFIDEAELPEFDETAALNEADELLAEVEAPETELPTGAEEIPVVDESETAFETEPEFAPDVEPEPEATQAEATVEQAEEAEPEPDFIDEAELPEFDETAALNEADELLAEVEAPETELPTGAEETPVVDESETAFETEPEFAPDIEPEPEATQAEAAVEQAEEAEPEPDFIDEAELPEFDEIAALNEADELLAEVEAPETELPTGAEETPVVDESETAFETEPEFAPDIEPEPEATQAEAAVEQAEEAEPEPDFIDEAELPEFDEIAALNEADELLAEVAIPEAEQMTEVREEPVITEPEVAPAIEPEATQAEVIVDQSDDIEPAPVFIDEETELPSFDEVAVLNETDELPPEIEVPEAELSTEAEETPVVEEHEIAPVIEPDETLAEEVVELAEEFEPESDFIDEAELPEFDEIAALNEGGEQRPESDEFEFVDEEIGLDDTFHRIPRTAFDEDALGELLDEDAEPPEQYVFEPNLDDERIASAGMDFESMLSLGGEDWNGFKLSPEQQASIPDEVPEDERDVWREDNQTQEPQADSENWEIQDELFQSGSGQQRHLTIDELMSQVEGDDHPFEEVDLKLDVGLNEFPDVIGDISNIDVDSNAEAAGKLDLAKIYIEMNDESGAVKLLEEAIVDGSDDIRQAAKRLIDELNRRS